MHQLLVVAPPEIAPRIRDALEPMHGSTQLRHVCTPNEGLIAIGEHYFDAVILALAENHNPAALSIEMYVDFMHQRPVVVLAEGIGEDATAELVRHGAVDVISYGRLTRLVSVLERELRSNTSIFVQRQNSRTAFTWFASIIHHLPVGIVYHNDRGEIVLCNETALVLLGLTEDELIGVTSLDPRWNVIRENGEDFPGSEHPSSVAARTKTAVQNVLMGVFRPKINDRVWLRVDAIPLLDRERNLAHVMVHFSNVTEHREMLDTIRQAEERFRLAFEHSGVGMVLYSPRKRIIQANTTACRIFGRSREELIGMRMEDLTHPDDIAMSQQKAASARSQPLKSVAMEKRYVQPSGAIVQCLVTVDAIPDTKGSADDLMVVINIQDITARKEVEAELKRLNAQLLQAKKMEALGILAGGMAHDFNNILAAITCSADVLSHDLRSLPNAGELPEIAFDLQAAAQRASDLIRQIVMFSRQSNQERIPVKLGKTISDAVNPFRKLCPSNVDVRVVPRSFPTVLANATQIQQVVTNLCAHALRSLENQGGTISVELETTTIDATLAKAIPELHEGRYARLRVTNSGPTMDARALERIFEPLSTSDSAGKNSGLGMVIVQGIIIAHGGAIRAQSTPHQGTAIDVWLPLTVEAPPPPASQPSTSQRGNNEHLLIVDDEESLARIVGRLLQSLGYRVTVQTQSSAALELFEKDPGAFHAVLLDLHMPRPGGIELARAIHAIRADLPIFIMSGFSDALGNTPPGELGVVGILQKPVGRDTLAAELRRILDPPR